MRSQSVGAMSTLSGGSSDAEVKNPEEDKLEEDKQNGPVDLKSINVDQLYKKYNIKNNLDLQKKFIELKYERKELRIKLDKF